MLNCKVGCIYSNKDKNFKANHNATSLALIPLAVVSIVTKIRILKQITTFSALLLFKAGCIYSNKDKNFKANHNDVHFEVTEVVVVSIVTKIRILKQITTNLRLTLRLMCCIYSNKDKNFKANHNARSVRCISTAVVSIVTKIRILKQITTLSRIYITLHCCIYSNKDKNFKANHNSLRIVTIPIIVVSIVTKIRILKQITTIHGE